MVQEKQPTLMSGLPEEKVPEKDMIKELMNEVEKIK